MGQPDSSRDRISVVRVALGLTGLIGIACTVLGVLLAAADKRENLDPAWRFLALAVVTLWGTAVGWRFLVSAGSRPGASA
ncbi:hypothetical protein GobsT_05410 [Gemmata obscuriglobus]|uniref:Uncharacterized protein n=1 Tax=Gemmata obscuriglobus TaxID=114 RepID=A0A2Z3HGG1_9BACT|nr:hypothetical protein [Gemmata obscuriglobus]AWM40894.1 hypothetical protein C1280_30495 [Gemmata obscuriglobus]QEG25806.1 hypothetical protein GobsT_05410 [Gemmata obscuriglobus]VTR99697.1 unnamed protein product [Gemmata obscuriglobus UQM 2246]